MKVSLTIAIVATLALAGTAQAKVRFFHSPSGNIQCQVSKQDVDYPNEAFCQTFSPPRTVTLTANGHSKRCGARCVGNGPENAFTLAYGKSVTVGPFKCTSSQAGMRCVVKRTGRGFSIASQAIKTF